MNFQRETYLFLNITAISLKANMSTSLRAANFEK